MPFELQTDPERSEADPGGKTRSATGPAAVGRPAARHRGTPEHPVCKPGELEEMDTSIVQILCRVSSQTGQLQIGEISDGFLASLKRRGLETFFVQPPPPSKPEPPTPQPKPGAKGQNQRGRAMPKKVLAVDDSATMRQLVKMTLPRSGYDVLEAEDGAKALQKATADIFDLGG